MTKRELSQLYYLNREIELEKQRLSELKQAATGITSRITGLPHVGKISDKTALAGAIADCADLIERKLAQAVEEYGRLSAYIAGIEDSEMRQIMRLRYIDGKSWTAVAFAVGEYDESLVRKKHNRFLKSSELSGSDPVN